MGRAGTMPQPQPQITCQLDPKPSLVDRIKVRRVSVLMSCSQERNGGEVAVRPHNAVSFCSESY